VYHHDATEIHDETEYVYSERRCLAFLCLPAAYAVGQAASALNPPRVAEALPVGLPSLAVLLVLAYAIYLATMLIQPRGRAILVEL
jgi:hypothetical protein